MKVYGIEGCDDLRYAPYKPQKVPKIPGWLYIFEASEKKIFCYITIPDLDPVVDFIRQATVTRCTLIKQIPQVKIVDHYLCISQRKQTAFFIELRHVLMKKITLSGRKN